MKKAGQKVAGVENLANRKEDGEVLSQPEKNRHKPLKGLQMRESLLEVWNVDIAKALRMCESKLGCHRLEKLLSA